MQIMTLLSLRSRNRTVGPDGIIIHPEKRSDEHQSDSGYVVNFFNKGPKHQGLRPRLRAPPESGFEAHPVDPWRSLDLPMDICTNQDVEAFVR